MVGGQLWFQSNASLASKVRAQLNTMIFDKALRRKEVANADAPQKAEKDDDDAETSERHPSFTAKNQVRNLFSVDVDRVAEFANYSFVRLHSQTVTALPDIRCASQQTLVDAPLELLIGTLLLYQWLGVAGLVGLVVNILFLPLNHFASKAFASTQDSLMSARDRRVSLMNELLGSIRAIKHQAWELPFEARVTDLRKNELKYLRRNYLLEIAFDLVWGVSVSIALASS